MGFHNDSTLLAFRPSSRALAMRLRREISRRDSVVRSRMSNVCAVFCVWLAVDLCLCARACFCLFAEVPLELQCSDAAAWFGCVSPGGTKTKTAQIHAFTFMLTLKLLQGSLLELPVVVAVTVRSQFLDEKKCRKF